MKVFRAYTDVTSLDNSKRIRMKYYEHFKFLDNELKHFKFLDNELSQLYANFTFQTPINIVISSFNTCYNNKKNY